MTTNTQPSRRLDTRRLLIAGGVGLVLLYGMFVATGYVWLHFVLKNDQVHFSELALFRWHSIRQGMAAEQFAAGKSAWDEKNYQAAYLAFISGVRNDPDNVAGRLTAARFLGMAGAAKLEINLLEDGLRRSPDDRQLIEQTFALLTTTGRDRRALELLHTQYAGKLSGPNGAQLRTLEILATLDTDGAEAAAALLEKSPDLKNRPESAPVVARVLWETRGRLAAIDLLGAYVQSHPGEFASYVQLAEWQSAAGMGNDAVQTAQRACVQFPKDMAPQALLIQMLGLSESFESAACQKAVESFLKDFGNRPEALTMLAGLAGRQGWVALARTLYFAAASRQPNLAVLALSYSDALVRNSRLSDAQRVLTEVEQQTDDTNAAFLRLLRQRQVEVAAALGDHDSAREYARRLASALGSDPEGMETFRLRFAQEKIPEAVAELAGDLPTTKVVGSK
jgi:tetratricopeptide (TPR) repeat protein